MTERTPPISVEELLAHHAWMGGLARSLVHDRHTSDDLRQEAILAAQRPSPPDFDVFGFLLVTPAGEAVPDAPVELRERRHDLIVRRTRTDEEGRFRFEGAGEDALDLEVQGPGPDGSWAAGIETRVESVAPGGSRLRVVLAGGLTLLVRLTRVEDGQPLEAGRVTVDFEPLEGQTEPHAQTFVGGSMSSVRVEVEEPGRYRVEVRVPGYQPWTEEAVEIGADRSATLTAPLVPR